MLISLTVWEEIAAQNLEKCRSDIAEINFCTVNGGNFGHFFGISYNNSEMAASNKMLFISKYSTKVWALCSIGVTFKQCSTKLLLQ